MAKKVVFYLKGLNKNIVITDKSGMTLEKISENVGKMLSSGKVVEFRTKSDALIAKTSEISAVLIQKIISSKSNDRDLNIDDQDNCVEDTYTNGSVQPSLESFEEYEEEQHKNTIAKSENDVEVYENFISELKKKNLDKIILDQEKEYVSEKVELNKKIELKEDNILPQSTTPEENNDLDIYDEDELDETDIELEEDPIETQLKSNVSKTKTKPSVEEMRDLYEDTEDTIRRNYIEERKKSFKILNKEIVSDSSLGIIDNESFTGPDYTNFLD